MLILFAILTCLMLAVILNDTTRYLIPNWIVLAVFLVYPAAVVAAHGIQDWKMACVVALCVFIVGFILFSLKGIGGGDIKLLTATSLYAGKEEIFEYMTLVILLGGGLAVLILIARPLLQYIFQLMGKSSALPRVLTPGEKYFPYGVAIAAAFLSLLWRSKFPGLSLIHGGTALA